MDWIAWLDEALMAGVITVIGSLVAILSGMRSSFKEDIDKRKVMWDEAMIHIHQKFDALAMDHTDIKRDLEAIKSELTEKVEKIMVDHASHERDQAVQLEILRDLKEMARNGK